MRSWSWKVEALKNVKQIGELFPMPFSFLFRLIKAEQAQQFAILKVMLRLKRAMIWDS